MPDQALLPPPRRSRARHCAVAHQHRRRSGPDTCAPWPALRPLPTDLCARHPRRPRQIADRAELSSPRRRYERRVALRGRGLQRLPPRLSAGASRKLPVKSRFSRPQKTSSSPPTAATAPHLAGVATIEVIKERGDATAVPVAGDEPDAFARGPAETRRCPRRESGAVDDEIAAVGGLHDLDHMLLRRQSVLIVVLVVPRAMIFQLSRKGRSAYQHGQRERR